ncbi:MAG: pyruvate kinase [Candidatus Gracilibacteria bacterium]|nr:pyruvate kinase [Candidatus Gracilibacteria bacterium]
MKKTKIIATLGPATDTKEKIKALYDAGINVVRFNYSHTNYEYFTGIINIVKELNESGETNLGIMADTKGPEIRTKKIEEKITISKDEIIYLTTINLEEKTKDDKQKIICDYEYIVSDLNIGDKIDIDTGLLKIKVIGKDDFSLTCQALNNHVIGSKRHLNLPGVRLKLPGVTQSDKEDLKFAVSMGVNFIAMSFVRNRENIIEMKNFLKEINAPRGIQIISKIENKEALDNIDEIIDESHGIMIARGDLGAEIAFETLPIIQREIATKCKKEGKFFIVATQMLETMITNPIPTRAEVTDIFNAAMQKADCTMLSGETAAGNYPIEAVKTMSNILEYTESQIKYKHDYFEKNIGDDEDLKMIIKNAVITAENIDAKNIIIFTNSGFMAKAVAAFRPNMHVFAFTYDDKIRKKMTILFGLKTFLIEKSNNDKNLETAIKTLQDKKLLEAGDKIVTIYDIEKNGKFIPSIQIITI